jgi:glycosyltransferase involved in cell wall biosynthesis
LFLFFSEEPVDAHLAGIDAEVIVMSASRETLWEAWTLPRAIRSNRIDVFHAPADRGLPLIKVSPSVVTVHDSYERAHWRSLFPTLKGRYWYWKNEIVNRARADAVITVSDTTKRELARLGVVPEGRIRRTHLAPALEFGPAPDSRDEEILREHAVTAPYFLYVGGYDERKNVDALVRAFDASRLATHQLVIVARKHGSFERLVAGWRALRCFDSLRLVESVDTDLPALYRRAQVFVNPSLWESFSFQTVEAMASGTPLLASNRKAIPEIAGDAAMYFDGGNISELAAAMERMAHDARLRDGLRARGLERVKQFSWSQTAQETMDVYVSILGREARVGGGA